MKVSISDPEHPLHHIFLIDLEEYLERTFPALFR
jgi:hypothetical protein